MKSHLKGEWILISKVNFKGEWVRRGEDEDWRGSAWLPARLCGSEYEGEECRSMKVYEMKEYGSKYEGEERREGEIQHDGRIFGQTSPHLTNLRQHNLSKNNPNTGRTHPLYARIYWLDLTNLLPIITQ